MHEEVKAVPFRFEHLISVVHASSVRPRHLNGALNCSANQAAAPERPIPVESDGLEYVDQLIQPRVLHLDPEPAVRPYQRVP